jgi:hypothetical protein
VARLHRRTGLVIMGAGAAFGPAGRIVIALAGVCLIALMTTGIHVWWTK